MTLNLPMPLYNRLKQRAERTRRTVEDELLEVVATGVSADEDLSADLTEMLSGLALLKDEALWHAARSHLPSEVAAE
jgi:plasmid stability protein